MMRNILVVVMLLILGGVLAPRASAAVVTDFSPRVVVESLNSVNGSGVTGLVELRQLSNEGGTQIRVWAFGLPANSQALSLYYDNSVCALEPYSASDVIGGVYNSNRVGIGSTSGRAEDNLAEINSVSVRRASDFRLLACAKVH